MIDQTNCGSVVQDQGQDVERGPSLDVVGNLLHTEFPMIPLDHIVALLRESLARTDGARIQSYRMLIAEREVRSCVRPGS